MGLGPTLTNTPRMAADPASAQQALSLCLFNDDGGLPSLAYLGVFGQSAPALDRGAADTGVQTLHSPVHSPVHSTVHSPVPDARWRALPGAAPPAAAAAVPVAAVAARPGRPAPPPRMSTCASSTAASTPVTRPMALPAMMPSTPSALRPVPSARAPRHDPEHCAALPAN